MYLSFDKGTIVIKFEPQEDSNAFLSHFDSKILWDQRIQAYRTPAHRYSEILSFTGADKTTIKDDVIQQGEVGKWSKIELREYQKAALDVWTNSGKRGLIVIPTGGGKTRIAIAALAQENRPTIILVPTRVLLEQWKNEIAKFYTGRIGILGDGKREIEAITIATFESAYRQMYRLGNIFQMLVVDEAHHFGLGARDEALEMSIAHFRLGLTATPISEELDSDIDSLIGHKLFELSISDLKGTALADFASYTLPIELNPAERAAYDGEMKLFKEFLSANTSSEQNTPWSVLVKLASRSPEGQRAMAALRSAKQILAYPERKSKALAAILSSHLDKKILLFTSDSPTALEISRFFLIMPITSQIKAKEREWALENFRAGSLRTLVSCRVLNEGVDVPDADVAVIVGGSFGKREHVQRIGRLLRPKPGKKATIYELVCRNTMESGQSKRRNLYDS